MPINFDAPVTTTAYATVLSQVRDHFAAVSKLLEGETLSGTIPTGAKRYNATSDLMEQYNGTTWVEMPLAYLKGAGGQLTGSLTYLPAAADFSLFAGTSDGADSKRIALGGGGSDSDTRGGYLSLYGNEHASLAGRARIAPGAAGYTEALGLTIFDAGASTIPASLAGKVALHGIGASSVAARMFIGDGAGWQMRLAKRIGSVTTDFGSIFDAGSFVLGSAVRRAGAASFEIDDSVGPAEFIASGAGSGFHHAGLVLRTSSTLRAAGMFMYNSASGVEWYVGRGYAVDDELLVNRLITTTGLTGHNAAAADPGTANPLMRLRSGGLVIPAGWNGVDGAYQMLRNQYIKWSNAIFTNTVGDMILGSEASLARFWHWNGSSWSVAAAINGVGDVLATRLLTARSGGAEVIFGDHSNWSNQGWAKAAILPGPGYSIIWRRGGGAYSHSLGVSGDIWYWARSDADNATTPPTYLMWLNANGELTTANKHVQAIDGEGVFRDVGLRDAKLVIANANTNLSVIHRNAIVVKSDGGSYTYTLLNVGTTPWNTGAIFTVANAGAAGNIVVTPQAGVNMKQAGTGLTGARTIAPNGVATFFMYAADAWMLSGAGVS